MAGQFQRALGLELSGVKNDRSCLCVLDYYPKNKKIIVSDIVNNFSADPKSDSDALLLNSLKINSNSQSATNIGLGVHAPTTLPIYMQKEFLGRKNSLAATSKDPEIRWMNHIWKELDPQPRAFAPYLQRPCEIWLRYLTKEHFEIPEGMGSNVAPIAARFQFLSPHLPMEPTEIWPRATVMRIVSSLGLPKQLAKKYSDFDSGLKSRDEIMERLCKKLPQLFIYEKDLEKIVLSISGFHAFFIALNIVLLKAGQTEKRPKGYPKKSAWIPLPMTEIHWEKV